MRKKYHESEHIDAQIRRVYTEKRLDTGVVNDLADRLGYPRWWVKRRAAALGLARTKEKPWSDTELEILEENSHKSLAVVQRMLNRQGYKRTTTAIAIKRKRLGFDLREERAIAGIYSSRQLAELMGIDAKSVTGWITKGLLKAKRRGTARTEMQHGDEWEIKMNDVRSFLIDYTGHWDHRKVDKYWLVDILSGNTGAKGRVFKEAG
jgi:hypothetical protein